MPRGHRTPRPDGQTALSYPENAASFAPKQTALLLHSTAEATKRERPGRGSGLRPRLTQPANGTTQRDQADPAAFPPKNPPFFPDSPPEGGSFFFSFSFLFVFARKRQSHPAQNKTKSPSARRGGSQEGKGRNGYQS